MGLNLCKNDTRKENDTFEEAYEGVLRKTSVYDVISSRKSSIRPEAVKLDKDFLTNLNYLMEKERWFEETMKTEKQCLFDIELFVSKYSDYVKDQVFFFLLLKNK